MCQRLQGTADGVQASKIPLALWTGCDYCNAWGLREHPDLLYVRQEKDKDEKRAVSASRTSELRAHHFFLITLGISSSSS